MLTFLQQFHPVDQEHYNLLTAHLKPRSFKKGELMTAPGQVQRELHFIKSGVQMSSFEGVQKTHVMAFTYPPGFSAIPDSFWSQTPSKYYLTSITDTETEYLTYTDLQVIFDRSQTIERLFRKMTEAVLAGVIQRHVELHALSMEERYLAFCRRSPHLLHLVPHKYIASYLGIDATNFSKLFNSVKF